MIACPQCGLRHTPRDNGLCPKCLTAISGFQPMQAAAPAQPAPAAAGIPTGARAAGVVLLLNALVNILSMAVLPRDSGALNPLHGLLVDVVVGAGLLTGKEKWHKWALVRVVLGGVIFGCLFGFRHDWWSLAFQLMLSASLLMLLWSEPGRVRIAAGVMVGAPYFLMSMIGLVAAKTGTNPIASAMLSAKGEIRRSSGTLRGVQADYCLELPRSGWYLRDAAVAKKDNPLADRWVTRPDVDAHVMVIAEEVPGAVIPQDKYEAALQREASTRLTGYEMIGREPVSTGAALHYRGTSQDLRLEYYRGAFTNGSHAYQVVAFATPESFTKVRGEITGIVKSFREGCDAGPATPQR